MKFLKQIFLYAGLMILFGGLIFIMLRQSEHTNAGYEKIEISKSANPSGIGFFENLFLSNIREALPRLLLQIIIIIASTRCLGLLFRRIGQPAVVGETVAGIILGPSLLGLLFPGVFHFIFPVESLSNLRFLSQIGLILFMFIVGLELDTGLLA